MALDYGSIASVLGRDEFDIREICERKKISTQDQVNAAIDEYIDRQCGAFSQSEDVDDFIDSKAARKKKASEVGCAFLRGERGSRRGRGTKLIHTHSQPEGGKSKRVDQLQCAFLSAPQVRNSIKAMVQSGGLSDEKAAQWKALLAEEEEVAAMRRRTQSGDSEAAYELGIWHYYGRKGLEKNMTQAFHMFKQAATLGSVTALADCGGCYEHGRGVNKNVIRAVVCYTQAAGKGSAVGCYILGNAFAHGILGLDKDEVEAREWFEKMAQCAVQDCDSVQERILR